MVSVGELGLQGGVFLPGSAVCPQIVAEEQMLAPPMPLRVADMSLDFTGEPVMVGSTCGRPRQPASLCPSTRSRDGNPASKIIEEAE